jgi:hypothetical protein
MNRLVAFVLVCALPLGANAFQETVIRLKGVTITVIPSAKRACGVDFLLTVSDGDQHLVKIDYSYLGTFKDNPSAPDVPLYWERGTRSNSINVSVGRGTMHGNLARVAAPDFPDNSLVCREEWRYSVGAASQYNASQDRRGHDDELRQREQARLDEINRRRAEQAERDRRAQQHRLDYLAAQEQARRDQLTAYKNSSPENARCIINEPADINRCEQAKARDRAELLRLRAAEIDAQRQRDAKAIADARQAEQFKRSQALYERQRSDPCGVAADQARRGPPVQQAQPNSAAARQQAEALAQWKQSQAGLDRMCAASRNQR